MTSECTDLNPADFAERMRGIPVDRPLAVAVSGGSDSVALMRLMARWAAAVGAPLPHALTVDHGLRATAAAEAEAVAAWAATLGLPHATLRWHPGAAVGNLQARARNARYRLMGGYCCTHRIATLVTAHTVDDQAETVLLRLARGSGVDGLGAMARIAPWPVADPRFRDLRVLRPLLDVDRAALRATLARDGHGWIDDPSNDDPRFARVQVRAAWDALAGLGITRRGLADTAARLADAGAALDWAAADLWARAAVVDPAGFVRLDRAALAAAPFELARRALNRALAVVGGGTYPPRHDRLRRLYDGLVVDGARRGAARTLAGCRIVPDGPGALLIVREPRALARRLAEDAADLTINRPLIWDNRFEITLSAPAAHAPWRARVAPLAPADWRALVAAAPAPAAFAAVPPAARATLPGVWHADKLVAAPYFGIVAAHALPAAAQDRAEFRAEFVASGAAADWLPH